MVEEYLLQILIRRKVSDNMYQGSIKIRELEKEIGKENLDKYLKMIREEFAGKEKVYLYFMQYERFEDKYTNPYLEKKGNYLLNSLLYDVIGKKEYKRIGNMFNGKKLCITLYKINENWDYIELKNFFEKNQGKNNKEIMEELGIETKCYLRKLKERTRYVTKDSL